MAIKAKNVYNEQSPSDFSQEWLGSLGVLSQPAAQPADLQLPKWRPRSRVEPVAFSKPLTLVRSRI